MSSPSTAVTWSALYFTLRQMCRYFSRVSSTTKLLFKQLDTHISGLKVKLSDVQAEQSSWSKPGGPTTAAHFLPMKMWWVIYFNSGCLEPLYFLLFCIVLFSFLRLSITPWTVTLLKVFWGRVFFSRTSTGCKVIDKVKKIYIFFITLDYSST